MNQPFTKRLQVAYQKSAEKMIKSLIAVLVFLDKLYFPEEQENHTLSQH